MTTILKFKLIFAVVLSFVGSGLNLAQAVVPDTINYQGYLTNASDQPVNSTETITFKIYSVDTDGIELWDQTKSVVIKDGKFKGTCANNNPMLQNEGAVCGVCGKLPDEECQGDVSDE